MRSRRRIRGLLLATAVALVAATAALAAGSAKTKLVRVTLKDAGIALSSSSAPVGTVSFAVVNAGAKRHSFKIAGKTTPVLAPRAKATLVVDFTRAANYVYSSTVAGDAARGLKGFFALLPAKTIAVTLTDSVIRLGAVTAPAGDVGFVVRNAGRQRHDFRIAGKRTPVLDPRETATLIVTFKHAGAYPYSSTLPGDVGRGLKGSLTVAAAAPPPATGDVAAGKQVFLQNGCGSCHTLKAAGTTGVVGPDLDSAPLTRATIVSRVTEGQGTMPSFAGTLTPQQIQAVADFILKSQSAG